MALWFDDKEVLKMVQNFRASRDSSHWGWRHMHHSAFHLLQGDSNLSLMERKITQFYSFKE